MPQRSLVTEVERLDHPRGRLVPWVDLGLDAVDAGVLEAEGHDARDRLAREALALYSTVTVTGRHKGFHVIFERQASLYTFHTRVVFEPPLPVAFKLTREGVVTKLGRMLGLPDVEIGDPEFDAAFKIVTDDRDKLAMLLTPEVKAALFALQANGGSAQITEHFIDVQRTFVVGELWNGDQLVLDLEPALAAANQLVQSASRYR